MLLPAPPASLEAESQEGHSTLRNISIALLVLSPLLIMTVFLLKLEMARQGMIVVSQAIGSITIASWILWLVLSVVFIMFKKNQSVMVICLALTPLIISLVSFF